MGITNQWRNQYPQSFFKKLLPYLLYAIFPIILVRLYFYPALPLLQPSSDKGFSEFAPISVTSSLSFPASSTTKEKEGGNGVLQPTLVTIKEKENGSEAFNSSSVVSDGKESKIEILHPASNLASDDNNLDKESGNKGLPNVKGSEKTQSTCDYTSGEWIRDTRGPLYNGSNCGTIKEGQNCMNHGRPDKDYLYWRWKPRECDLQRFNPDSFLQILEGKHLAFVGDSMARNQLESLLCMLSSVFPSNLVYANGDDNKFRRWHFPSHNVNISVYWSPFLVKGLEKTNDGKMNYNKLYFDSVDEKWASDLDSIDMVVLSIGHWYLHPALYLDNDLLLGCHFVKEVNCTETGFIDVFGKAFNTTLKAIIQRKGSTDHGINVIVTTFSPHHFEGDWDKYGACPKIKPYKEGDKALEGMDADMRNAEVKEVERANVMLNNDKNSPKVRIEALDVTKLALMRPDGHPGPYMHPFPFADGIKERVQNDCVHWCMPGPIDIWNEIMLDIMKRWSASSMG